MNPARETTEGGKSPLLVEGMAPLDVLLKRLGFTQEQFCSELGIGTSTYRRWRLSGIASLDHVQAKRLDAMLRSVGLSIQDLPDSLTRYAPSKNA
jgi:transcriptional regulator with XRE-family HTH domain